jgi:hypothetical protein
MKYIIFEDEVSGLIQPVVFGEHTSHHQIKIERAKPVSAGFLYFERGALVVSGKSDSLKLGSRQSDLPYIELMLADAGTMFFTPFDE